MNLSCVFGQAKIVIAAAKSYGTNSHCLNLMNINIHPKKPFMNLLAMTQKAAQGKGNIYAKMPMSKYTADTKVKRQLKLLDCGFQDLRKALDLASAKTDIVKIVRFVLDQQIEVSKDNIDHSDVAYYTTMGRHRHKRYKQQLGFKVGRFTKAENKIIHDNWVKLMVLNSVEEPEVLLHQLGDKKRSTVSSQKIMRSIIGIYLGQGLDPKRHCANVFGHAVKILTCKRDGKFTPEEDKIILEEVDKNGDCIGTWKYLCSKLARNPDCCGYEIRRRYTNVLLNKSNKSGKWSFEEDIALLEHLFRDQKICSIDAVKSIKYKDFENVEGIDRVQAYIHHRWDGVVKPILLSYHLNMLHHFDRPKVLRYVLETGVKYKKEIDWNDALKKFPSHTPTSLGDMLRSVLSKEATLNVAIKTFVQTTKVGKVGRPPKVEYTPKEKEYREMVVLSYLDNFSSKDGK